MERADGFDAARESSFTALAQSPQPALDRLLLALAGEFHPVDRPAALGTLDGLARPLFGIAELDGALAAQRFAASLWHEAELRPASIGPDTLFLDRTLHRRRGHPAVLAAVYVEVARRAGVALALFSSPDAWFAGLHDDGELTLINPAPAGPPASRCEPMAVRRHCAHELAYALLSSLIGHARERGGAGAVRRAAELRRLLPIHHGAQGDPARDPHASTDDEVQ